MNTIESTGIVANVQRFANDLNCMGATLEDQAELVSQALQGVHRTLQASAVRILLHGLQRYGQDAGVDLRNAAAVEACKELLGDIPPIPFI